MVISRDPAASSRAPNHEVQLALPPGHRSVLPVVPRLVCHSDVPGKRRVLIIGEDVWEFGKEVTSLVINHYLLAGQRNSHFLFEMAARSILRPAIKRKCLFIHALVHCVRDTHRNSKW